MYAVLTQATVVPTREWQDYDIPICFLGIQHPDLRFHVADGDQGFEEELENLTLQAVSFVVRSHKNAHFDFEVKSLSSVLDPSLERIKTVFPQRPVFFRACADYSRVSIGDYETNEELGSRVFSGSKPV